MAFHEGGRRPYRNRQPRGPLGNPYDVSFNLSSITLTGFQSSVQIWNPRYDNGVGLSRGRWEVLPAASTVLPAWQGFFVERTTLGAGATSLTLPYSGRTTGGTFYGKGGEASVAAARIDLSLRLTSASGTGGAGDFVAIETRPDALEGWDTYDASKLAPLGGAVTLSLGGTRGGATWWQALRSLPSEGAAPVEMPLRIKTSTGGTARLSWSALPATWRAELRDTRTGAVVDARRDSLYSFSLAAATDDSTRFVLRLVPATATAAEAALAAGAAEVSPVWPNPARSSARIVVRVGAREQVRAVVYDALGREVATVFEGSLEGRAEIALPVSALAPGAYVVRVTGERFAESRMLTVLR